MFAGYANLAKVIARFTGRPVTFLLACLTIVVWAITGPLFGFSDTWQLVINTGTTIVTFLMVFLIQNSQNRDTEAIQIKLDELIRATKGAQNAMMALEDIDEGELTEFRERYRRLAARANAEMAQGHFDADPPGA